MYHSTEAELLFGKVKGALLLSTVKSMWWLVSHRLQWGKHLTGVDRNNVAMHCYKKIKSNNFQQGNFFPDEL